MYWYVYIYIYLYANVSDQKRLWSWTCLGDGFTVKNKAAKAFSSKRCKSLKMKADSSWDLLERKEMFRKIIFMYAEKVHVKKSSCKHMQPTYVQ